MHVCNNCSLSNIKFSMLRNPDVYTNEMFRLYRASYMHNSWPFVRKKNISTGYDCTEIEVF